MYKPTTLSIALVVLIVIAGTAALPAVKPHALFSDGAVLQQGISVPVWGTASDYEKVTVKFQDQKVSTTAKNGRWMVRLKPLKAGGPFTMTISGENTIEVKNVLVGEVWVCGGQSNMAWPLTRSENSEAAIASSKDTMLRLFSVPHADLPPAELKASWVECGPDTVAGFSAVGYFFGRDLRKALKVPVGLINTAVGGTPAEAWTCRRALSSNPELSGIIEQARSGKGRPGCLYNGMIAPILPFAIKGVIWYQGESNAARAYQYQTLFSAMIRCWREGWGQGDFPFLFVQLAPFRPNLAEGTWAELREAQRLTASRVPNTAMAVITDVGDEKDIHPVKKEPVGARLALAARSVAYGHKVVSSGPSYKAMKVVDGKAVLKFECRGSGLTSPEEKGKVLGFEICGEDGKFVPAQAEIKKCGVIVWSPEVPKPVAVRYGWSNCPTASLFNKEGLPASPFRTDDFPFLTARP
jgi:sialate O-acetylesterase